MPRCYHSLVAAFLLVRYVGTTPANVQGWRWLGCWGGRQIESTRILGLTTLIITIIMVDGDANGSKVGGGAVMSERFHISQAKIRQLNAKNLAVILTSFEARFGMASADFYAKYNSGALDDNPDYIRWASYYDMAAKVGAIPSIVEA